MAKIILNQFPNTVFGKVTDQSGRPIANLTVALYDVDMRQWHPIAGAITDSQGKYEVYWTQQEVIDRGKKTADLAVKVFSAETNLRFSPKTPEELEGTEELKKRSELTAKEIKGNELFKSALTDVKFNAGRREEINVTVTVAIPVEGSEFDRLRNDVSFLANDIIIADLVETKEQQDVTFLSRELEAPAKKIEYLVLAHRLQQLSKIDADFFYALFRKDTLLSNDFFRNGSVRLSVDMDNDVQMLLFDAALVDQKKVIEDINTAVTERIVSASVSKLASRNLEILSQYRKQAEEYYKEAHPKKAISLITSLLKKNKLAEIQQLFENNKNDLNGFFEKVTDPAFFSSKKNEKEAKANIELGRLFGFSNEAVLHVAKSKDIRKPEDIRNLARLNKAEWVKELSKGNKELKDTQAVSTYASVLVRKLEKEFPSVAFTAQLEREKKQVLKGQEQIVSFLNKQEKFDLKKDNLDRYLKENKVAVKESEGFKEELKSIQRIFKLVPHYGKTMALHNEHIHSAQRIVALGKVQFVNEIGPKAGLSKKEAADVYRKAEAKNTGAMLLLGNLQDSMSVMDVASFETTTLAAKLEAVSKDFPNLKSLFKLTDSCQCEHCRSVYSPAAYLVEILEFLGNRSVVAGNAKSVLFNRRPDLGDIDLGCANANTPVKYIDLVCELLEETIAPDQGISYSGVLADGADPFKGKISASLLTTLKTAGLPVTANALIHETESALMSSDTLDHYLRDTKVVCKVVNTSGNNYKIYRLRQTLSTAEELDAAPEYVNIKAYDELRNKNYAFKLPFDLNHAEAKAYFDRFDIERPELMQVFQKSGNPADEAIAAERLGLTEAEYKLVVAAPVPNNNAAQQGFWNVPAPGNVLDYMKQADQFMDRTGLSYKDLNLLLKLNFIDKNGNLFIRHNDLSCDTAKKEIANIDLDVLDRIHRFLRLQKKTGWKFEVLDAILSQANLGAGLLTDPSLIKAAEIKAISDSTGIKVEELTGCFGDIPHAILLEDIPKPLYHQLFLNKAKNGILDERLLPQNITGSQPLGDYLSILATCLQLKQKDLELLLPLLPDNNLNYANLSKLLAASRLIKKLKIKAEEFVLLEELSGIDSAAAPSEMLKFIALAGDFKNSPLKIAEVKFMLNHEAVNLADRELKTGKIEEILNKLKTAYKAVITQHTSKYDPLLNAEEQTETLTAVLSALERITETDVKAIIGFLGKAWTTAANAKSFIDEKLDVRISRTKINAAIDALNAVAAGADTSSEQKGLIKELLDAISDHQIRIGKQTLLEQTIAAAFKTDLTIAAPVLKYTLLKKTAPGTDPVSTLLTDNFDNTINTTNYPNQYLAIKLLYKLFPLVNAFKLSETEVEWYLSNNASATIQWLELDSIPFEAGQSAESFTKYLDFAKIVAFSRQFGPVANPLDAEKPVSFFSLADLMALPAGTAGSSDFFDALSLLTAYDKAFLEELDVHLFGTFDIANYAKPANTDRVLKAAEMGRMLDASVAQIKGYIRPGLGTAEVNDLRASLKSRYDEDTWLSTLKEVTDKVRPQKRDALITYLLATNPAIKSENELYDYFLVDVEMEACMPSSRIVQAHNSIQLFVQRCMMGLEPDSIADMDKDPGWDQWKWMKNYRVWEANRKVFLYPENYYDVTLSDEKSYLLTEFINELQQNELTNDTAEEAIKKYLEKLDNIAFLEVMATWYDTATQNMHVFARTKGGEPSIYYYRRFENERYWTPWEKVELDISGDHLLAFSRNNRLHLAWPMFSEEANPDQKSKVPAASDQGGYVDNDKPKRKLKIQLAISEYTNKKWQPKKVSRDAVLTPNDFTNDDSYFVKDKYNLIYSQPTDQVCIFSSTWDGDDYHNINGIFNIAGCKGYPELVFQGNTGFPDFLPDFKDAEFNAQRYQELVQIAPDELAVRNGISQFSFLQLLNKTPGKFRISYPHQFTNIDLIALIYQLFQLILNKQSSTYKRRGFKLPLGTLLPYFKEDSKHAYVVIPGFYRKELKRGTNMTDYSFTDIEKRTASDVFKLMDAVINWIKKIILEFETNPPADLEAAVQVVITDPDFQDILTELSKYEALDFVLNFLIGKTGNADFDRLLEGLRDAEGLVYGEQFKNMYHPLVCALRSILYKDGIPALMKRDTQLKKTSFNFATHYEPNIYTVPQTLVKHPDGTQTPSFPVEDIDFTSDGSYSVYNWDLFFRVPLHIAGSLTKNQRFEEALTWFHYMFNPTGALPGNGVQKYWVTKPFYLNQETDYVAQRIDTLMYSTADASNPQIKELEFAIEEWRNKPFRPDVIARFRPVAYQKALLMKYIDNLVEWGDYLFRQDTMESIAQATQMYILADKLLGPKPRIVSPAVKPPYETYNQMEGKLDSFGNALIELENILPDLTVLPEGGDELPAPPITLSMLYFCIPHNEKMTEYWNLVADRLFKIRHCQNIDGIERSLALFAPPIDPAMLVRAAASGLDLSSVIAGLNAPTPYYRFNIMSQKATELAQEIRGLGNSLLQALEKRDSESLGLLRNELELKVLNAVKDIKKLQIKESKEQIEVLQRTKKVTEERQKYYANIEKIISKEQLNLDKLKEANDYQFSSQIVRTVAGALRMIPEFHLGASGFGGSPQVVMQLGGSAISTATSIGADILNILSTMSSYEASRASILGGYDRRYADWKLQERLAGKELASIDKQIAAAEIRREIAETDLKNHELQIENAKKTDDFMRGKYTNKELYDWMIGQISSVYFKSYQLAHDFAKKAERCYKFELGNDDTYISYGYWDSMKKGLQSADQLIHDIKRMETGYLDKNKRQYEITKHVSLAQLDPLALARFKASGICDFEIPEVLYDLDNPGQYFRRLKSVSMSIPCIAGPYTSVSAKMSLVSNKFRKNTNADNLAGTGYAEDPGNDERFNYTSGAIQSVVTSSSQNDSGVFELSFNDERYLPFEGAGAVSGWRIELPTEVKQFDYSTISDVILHIRYTAREGGSSMKTAANAVVKDQLNAIRQGLGQDGLHLAINMKHDLQDKWHLLKTNGQVQVNIDKSRFPYWVQLMDTEIAEVMFVAKLSNNPANFPVSIDGTALNLARIDELKLARGISSDLEWDTPFILSAATANLEELMMVVKYTCL